MADSTSCVYGGTVKLSVALFVDSYSKDDLARGVIEPAHLEAVPAAFFAVDGSPLRQQRVAVEQRVQLVVERVELGDDRRRPPLGDDVVGGGIERGLLFLDRGDGRAGREEGRPRHVVGQRLADLERHRRARCAARRRAGAAPAAPAARFLARCASHASNDSQGEKRRARPRRSGSCVAPKIVPGVYRPRQGSAGQSGYDARSRREQHRLTCTARTSTER